MPQRPVNGRLLVVAMLTAAVGVALLSSAAVAATPPLYGFCMEVTDAKRRTLPEQVRLLHDLGFQGAGYPLWLGEKLHENLRVLDNAGLKVYLLWTAVNLKPDAPRFDPRLPEAIGQLKGRPVTIGVLLQGLPPQDPRGMEPAIQTLRRLGDVAARAELNLAVYHHHGDWAQSLFHAADVVEKTNHPRVGLCFNLCHWLMVDGDKDCRPLLKENAARLFAVTINGAKRGAKTWTHGLIQPLDQGDFDVRALLATLEEIGYRGPIGLMCFGIPGDAQEHLRRSIKVWQTWQTGGDEPPASPRP